VLASAEPTRPLVAAGAVVTHADLVRDRLALDDERTPPMQDKVINLANAGPSVMLGLIRINDPQVIQDEQSCLSREVTVQVEGHLPLGLGARTEPRV
jgi:hypothetical protein